MSLAAGEGPTEAERAARRKADLAERRALFVDAWGEPRKHQSAQNFHRAFWEEAVARCRSKMRAGLNSQTPRHLQF